MTKHIWTAFVFALGSVFSGGVSAISLPVAQLDFASTEENYLESIEDMQLPKNERKTDPKKSQNGTSK